jgi:integrase
MRRNRLETNNAETQITDPDILDDKNEHGYKTGTWSDGGGLYLKVQGPRQASWVYRWKSQWIGLGSADIYNIKQAREKARKAWEAACKGEDPTLVIKAMRRSPSIVPALAGTMSPAPGIHAPAGAGKTFSEALEGYIKHKEQKTWSASNAPRERRAHEREFAKVPDLTAMDLSAIDELAKNTALNRWTGKKKQTIGYWLNAVIVYGLTGRIRERRVSADDQEHHASMPYDEVPALYAGLAKVDDDDARALCFTILTGARTDEVIGAEYKGKVTKAQATWSEIGEHKGKPTWIIPKERMKGNRRHRVPLTAQMVALLGERRADNAPLFEVSHSNALLNTLKTNGGNGYTVHGMRSSFSDWVLDETKYGADLADMCIAHLTRSKVRASYQRSDQLEKRREIMTAWSNFVTPLAEG